MSGFPVSAPRDKVMDELRAPCHACMSLARPLIPALPENHSSSPGGPPRTDSCLSQHPSSLAYVSLRPSPYPATPRAVLPRTFLAGVKGPSLLPRPAAPFFLTPLETHALPAPLRFDALTCANVDKTTCTPPSWPWFLRLSLSSPFPETFSTNVPLVPCLAVPAERISSFAALSVVKVSN